METACLDFILYVIIFALRVHVLILFYIYLFIAPYVHALILYFIDYVLHFNAIPPILFKINFYFKLRDLSQTPVFLNFFALKKFKFQTFQPMSKKRHLYFVAFSNLTK